MSAQRISIYKGAVVNLSLETLVLPDQAAQQLELVRHPGGAAVVAIDAQQRVCLLRQYRPAIGEWLWELPAGKIDAYEIPLLTANRELEEETGLRASVWTTLGSIYSTPGFCDEMIYLFMARGLEQGEPRPQPHEHLEVHWLDYTTALTWVFFGKIRDAKTIAGLYQAQAYLLTADSHLHAAQAVLAAAS